jgi:hypothetical protein
MSVFRAYREFNVLAWHAVLQVRRLVVVVGGRRTQKYHIRKKLGGVVQQL